MNLLDNLRLFNEIAGRGSLSAAGRHIGLAPSGVSRRLEDLEAYLEVSLLRRTPRGIVLTDEGRVLLENSTRLLDEADGLKAVVKSLKTEVSGHLRLTAPNRFGEKYIAPLVPVYLNKFPNVSVELTLTDQYLNISELGHDLALRISRTGCANDVVRRLAPNQRILVASPAYLSDRKPPLSPVDIGNWDGLMLGDKTEWSMTNKQGDTVTVSPKERLRCRQGDVLSYFCVEGLGVALKSLWDVHEHLHSGELVHILPEWVASDSMDVTLVLPSRRYIPKRAEAFIELLESKLSSPPPWER